MQEWDYEANADLDPQTLKKGSNKKAWWKCTKCGGKWQAAICGRAGKKPTGCPYCAGQKVLAGFNDLKTKYPHVAKEWHPTKNGDLKPSEIISKSHRKVWWLCTNGHEFEQAVDLRTIRKYGCPYCSNQKVLVGFNDLNTTHPHIAKEWHPTKNGDKSPFDVIAGSHQKVWWICTEGHSYEQSVNKRTSREQSCPYCSGHKAWKGLNDFQTRFPKIAKEWHPTKNGDLKAMDVTYGSGKRVWWICPIGHEYQAVVRDRGVGGTNCPVCDARRGTSLGEQAIFYYIKKIYPDARNRFNEIFDTSMEFDVYIPSLKIAIEYDGCHWHRTENEHSREIKKYAICKEHNIILYRVKESNDNEWNDVADKIFYVSKVRRSNFFELEHTIIDIVRCIDVSLEIDIDIDRDKNEIQKYLYQIENSLQEKRPDVAEKWDFEKNKNLSPDMFTVSSNEIVWWKCNVCGHKWKNSINSMTRTGRYGCAKCANKQRGRSFIKGVVERKGSLAEKFPSLAKEWHPYKNGELTPNDITAGHFKPVWWKCSKCDYEWQASPANRKKGVGCPCCSGRVPNIGINDLETKCPEIASEWDYERNYPLTPREFLPKSGKKVWWKCSVCGKSWESAIRHRTKINSIGCRSCKHKLEKKQFPLKGKQKLEKDIIIKLF